jgi:molybdopterin converting factor small subunit
VAITIKALRPFSDWIGSRKVQMEWSGGTVEDLIRVLAEKKGPEVEAELKGEDGTLAYLVSINGKVEGRLSAQIEDGDEIFFCTPLGGG